MVISAKKVLELNERYKLIENLYERELTPEGVGIDIRVGEVYKITGKNYSGEVPNSETPGTKIIADITKGDKKIILNPGDFVIVKTIEIVNVPTNKILLDEGKEPVYLRLHAYPRSTLQRSGILLAETIEDPGYFGELAFALSNIGNIEFELELGARVANLVFEQVLEESLISANKVVELNKKYKLIENLQECEFTPESVGIDVRVGEVYKIKGKGYLGVINRETPNIEKIADIKQGHKKIILNPGDYCLIKTIEKVNVPAEKIILEEGKKPVYLMLRVFPLNKLSECGTILLATKTDPGYYGELTFGLVNKSDIKYELNLGTSVAKLVFEEVFGDLSRPYDGQWKGGRVATEGREKQI